MDYSNWIHNYNDTPSSSATYIRDPFFTAVSLTVDTKYIVIVPMYLNSGGVKKIKLWWKYFMFLIEPPFKLFNTTSDLKRMDYSNGFHHRHNILTFEAQRVFLIHVYLVSARLALNTFWCYWCCKTSGKRKNQHHIQQRCKCFMFLI